MRTELGLVLKHVTGGAEKVNAANYLKKLPPPADEYYYEEDTYALNDRTGVSDQISKSPIKRIGVNVKEINVRTMVTIIERDNMFKKKNITMTTSLIRVIMVIEMIRVGPLYHLIMWMFFLGDGIAHMV